MIVESSNRRHAARVSPMTRTWAPKSGRSFGSKRNPGARFTTGQTLHINGGAYLAV